MSVSEEYVTKFQKLYEEKYGIKLTRQEAYNAGSGLVNMIRLLQEADYKDHLRKEKLKEFPKGFHLTGEGIHNCGICGSHVADEQSWYDKWGIKCLACQKAVDEKIIPGKICYNNKLWYSMFDFDYYLKLKSAAVRKLARQGILKARVVPNTNFHVFLISENKDVLPPKEIFKSRSVPVDKFSFTVQKWYEYLDPEEMLKNYKIWPHLTVLKN